MAIFTDPCSVKGRVFPNGYLYKDVRNPKESNERIAVKHTENFVGPFNLQTQAVNDTNDRIADQHKANFG